jgi:hypothetical protein
MEEMAGWSNGVYEFVFARVVLVGNRIATARMDEEGVLCVVQTGLVGESEREKETYSELDIPDC